MDSSLQPLTIHEQAPGHFSLAGELDMATAPQLDALVDVHGALCLDLRDVSFIDSSGIVAFLRLYRRCDHEGCSFLIETCSPQAERVLRIVGLYDILTEEGATDGPDLQSSAPEVGSGVAAID